MTARERKASGGISVAATAPHVGRAANHANGRHGTEAVIPEAAIPCLLRWEDWFHTASPAQRSEMLALAAQQGLLYASQVPAPANGQQASQKNKPPAEIPVDSRPFIRLLAGQFDEDLASFPTQPLVFFDDELDGPQREAVARALFTPDVFLLQGLPGTGRSRVVTEILSQAAARGERALFLSNHPSSLDAVLARLAQSQTSGNQAVFALRFLGPDETPASLPQHVVPLTLTERRRAFKDHAWQSAAKARTEADHQVAQRRAEEACWPGLRAIAEEIAGAQKRREACAELLSTITIEVEREAEAGRAQGGAAQASEPRQGFAAAVAELEQRHLEAMAAVKADLVEQEKQRAAAAAELAEVAQEIGALIPLAEAKQKGRWWAPAWWRATCRGGVPATMSALQGRCRALEDKVQALARETRESTERHERLQDQYQAERTRVLQTEIEARRQEALRQKNIYETELEQLARVWQKHVDVLEMPAHRPTENTLAALTAASASWENQRRLDMESHEFACRWEKYLAEAGDQLVSRIPDWANVLAGTMTALRRDPSFAEGAAEPFDVLVLEDADQFTETELVQASRQAGRLVLVAETHGPGPNAPGAPVKDTRPGIGGPLISRLGCFQRFWQALNCDSPRLGYAWSWENARLCCTLRPVLDHDRGYLEIERVVDFPEIELRILAVPKAPPLLAQVVFPAAMTIAQAKEFIYRELEEAAVQGFRGGAWVEERGPHYVLNLAAGVPGDAVCLDLEKGLREWFAPATAHTYRFEFCRDAGWARAAVDQWSRRYLGLRDRGRTMALRVPHRLAAGLAGPLNEILFGGGYSLASGDQHRGTMEFIAVPSLFKDAKARVKSKPLPGANGFAGLPREGAGLELDLAAVRAADVRGADRIPVELRAELPRRGFANYLEAQAVIRKLEELISRGDVGAGAGEPVAVIALYEGQVTLLRRLAEQSESLRRQPGSFEIGLASTLREREWTTVLVSLTRSHGHRAVSFGDRESDLVIALTRARERLILFGDAGTLVKRSHWHGPLDHLDAAAADLEAARLTALLRWLALSI